MRTIKAPPLCYWFLFLAAIIVPFLYALSNFLGGFALATTVTMIMLPFKYELISHGLPGDDTVITRTGETLSFGLIETASLFVSAIVVGPSFFGLFLFLWGAFWGMMIIEIILMMPNGWYTKAWGENLLDAPDAMKIIEEIKKEEEKKDNEDR